jgi:Fur family ferric uptake transcriptional regulator
MSCEDETMQALKESGHRLTPQRLFILSALRHASGHMTAVQILDEVKESYPYIDVSTVYRTLGVLKSMRVVSETDIGGGEYLYEWLNQERHHHLICRECDSRTLLDHRYLENLGIEILDVYGFQADIDHFAITGLCQGCRQKTKGT